MSGRRTCFRRSPLLSGCVPRRCRRSGEERTQSLLEELEDTYAELRRYSESVRELAISEERTRMAREMHDSLGHYLTVVNVQLEAVTKLLDRNPDKARESAAQAKVSASEALSEVRRSVRALRPRVMEDRVGTGALAALARDFEGTGIAVSFEVIGEELRVPPEAELILYRALQESLTNALKHSGGRRVEAQPDFRAGQRLPDSHRRRMGNRRDRR